MDRVNSVRKRNLDFFKRQLTSLIRTYDREEVLCHRIKKNKADAEAILSLADVYYDNGDYNLLYDLLEQFGDKRGDSAKVDFYRGIIAFLRCDYKSAELFFDSAVGLEESYLDKIQDKKRALADFYYLWGQTVPVKTLHRPEDQNGIYYRSKGLRIFPQHQLLQAEFKKLSESSLKDIQENIQKKGISALMESEECLAAWIRFMEKEGANMDCVQSKTAVYFFRMYGKILLDKGLNEAAYEHYKRSIHLVPAAHELYVAMADVCFALNDFEQGMASLKQAVSLDKQNAVYWKNMGENLQARKDFFRAVRAYELYFEAVPSSVDTLYRIGECYLHLGNSGAAEAAFEKYNKLKPKLSDF